MRHYIGLWLLLACNTVAEWAVYENLPAEDVAHLREQDKDAGNLEETLMAGFAYDQFLWPEEVPLFHYSVLTLH